MAVKRIKTFWRVFYRKNIGEETTKEMKSFEDCLLEDKKVMVPRNYIICREDYSERVKRWDREIISGSNRWYSCVVNETEIPGRLVEINRVTTPRPEVN